MEKSTISYVLSIVGLIFVLAACSNSELAPQDTPSESGVTETVVMNDTLTTLAVQSSNELTFLSPITPRLGVYALLRADIPISMEFFAVENGQVTPTPLGPSLSTTDGSIRLNNSRPRYSNYSANWNTALSNRQNGDVVRVEVRLPHAPAGAPACTNGVDKNNGCLGFFDVQLWNSGWDVYYRRWFQYDSILDIRNRWQLPIKFHIAQGTDIPTSNPNANTAPTLSIDTPSNNASFTTSDSITLTASANDAEDGNISNSIQWSSNNFSGTIPSGSSAQLGRLPAGSYTFTARVADSKGATAQETVTFTVTPAVSNTAPTLSITSPSNNSSFTTNDSITLTAQANDAQDGNISSSIQWSSTDFSGTLPNGASVQLGKLPAGSYTFVARVSDSQGAAAAATVNFTVTTAVTNTPPVLNITSPSSNSSFTTDDSITLTAQANDAQDGNISSNIQWSSTNFSGTLPRGGNVQLGKLAAGSYTFTARVTDSQNLAAQATVSFTVSQTSTGNTAPTVTFLTPNNNSVFTAGAAVVVIASAIDAEDGMLHTAIQWSSNTISQTLRQGRMVSLNNLPAGQYDLTARATDSQGVTGEATLNFTIQGASNTAPTLTITSPSNNAGYTTNDTITLVATANDAQDGNISNNIQWSSSDFTGTIARGGTVNLGRLPSGSYTFTARVVDSNGASAQQSVRFGVTGNTTPNTPPSITITSPTQGNSLTVNDSITLTATANDAQDGDISSRIQWVAIQGYTGTLAAGPRVVLGTLPAGNYIFEARVTDSQGASFTNRIAFPILAGGGSVPRIAIYSPSPNAYNPVLSTQDVILEAKATDAEDGDISQRVQWSSNEYQGNIPAGGRVNIGRLEANKSYTFTATVTDNQGNTARVSITFTVRQGTEF